MKNRTPLAEAPDAVLIAQPLRLAWHQMDPETPNPDLERLARTIARIVDRVRSERESSATEAA